MCTLQLISFLLAAWPRRCISVRRVALPSRVSTPARTEHSLKPGRIATVLVIVADDYGYAAAYDGGILEAVQSQAVDAVSVMALREPDAGALVPLCERAEVDVGLHLERPEERSPAEQLAAFERLFGRAPAYVDGHHHCHAADGVAREVALAAAELGIPVRSVDPAHRELLRGLGVSTADRLVGRMGQAEPLIPAAIRGLVTGAPPPGVTEWMVHPGHSGGPSSYDTGRELDLAELLRFGDRARWARLGVLRAPPSRAALG
jgi:hypothetical protein